jgi:hypothetical protein
VINVVDMLHDMSNLVGGPLTNANGKLVGVNAFSSEGRVTHQISGGPKRLSADRTPISWPYLAAPYLAVVDHPE